MQIKTKIVSCHRDDSKQVKQEVNGTVILPPLVFPAPALLANISLLKNISEDKHSSLSERTNTAQEKQNSRHTPLEKIAKETVLQLRIHLESARRDT